MECELCKVKYVEKAETASNITLNNHRKDVNNPKSIPADLHFRKPGHSLHLHAKYALIEQLSNNNHNHKNGKNYRIYRISSDNKLDSMYGGKLSQRNSLTCFDDHAEFFLFNFVMYMQIASTDIYMATQNCIQNTASLQSQKYLLNLKQDLREHLCSCRPLAPDTEVVHEFTETATLIAAPVEKHV